MSVDEDKFREMFDYLSTAPSSFNDGQTDGLFVFGRADASLARQAADLLERGIGRYALLTGGIGKDSGYLATLGIPEASWLASLMVNLHGTPPGDLLVETVAANGGENCRFGLAAISESERPHERLTVVAHATSLRRLTATLEAEAANIGFNTALSGVPTSYAFDPTNPTDQKEAVAELLRLADWPTKGWCTEQPDLPTELVDNARSLTF